MKSPYLPVAIDAVKAAEKVILGYFQTDIAVDTKDDLSPVTIADREAEEIIKQTIREKFPEHTFYGEEGEKVSLQNHKGFTWIIDPIDGTRGFVRGHPLFGTLLALMHDGEIILGLSNTPVMHELMYAARGEGSFLNGKPVHVSSVDTLSEAYISSGRPKYFEDIDRIPQLLAISRQAKWARGIGDLWIYHLVAQGKVDIMLEGVIKLWDIAAAKIIIEEAGGKLTQLNGRPITYQSTTVLATNGLLHDEIVAAMRAK